MSKGVAPLAQAAALIASLVSPRGGGNLILSLAEKDAPILAAAMALGVDYLVTLDRRHFLDDPEVARRSGLRIGTPGDFLAWLRGRLERGEGAGF